MNQRFLHWSVTPAFSIEVFAALNTAAEQMLTQSVDMSSWIPNAYVNCARMKAYSSPDVGRTRHTGQYHVVFLPGAGRRHICGHTGPKIPVLLPFIGRLDDRGENGMDLIENIQRMYKTGDGHVEILAASIRQC